MINTFLLQSLFLANIFVVFVNGEWSLTFDKPGLHVVRLPTDCKLTRIEVVGGNGGRIDSSGRGGGYGAFLNAEVSNSEEFNKNELVAVVGEDGGSTYGVGGGFSGIYFNNISYYPAIIAGGGK